MAPSGRKFWRHWDANHGAIKTQVLAPLGRKSERHGDAIRGAQMAPQMKTIGKTRLLNSNQLLLKNPRLLKGNNFYSS